MTGSWVTKPGERHAIPTSWIPRPSRAVIGRAEAGWFDLSVFFERSSLRGRGRVLVMPGEAGSFLTTILGGAPVDREALGGEDLGPEPAALGLLLLDECAVAFDAEGAAADRCAEGEMAVVETDVCAGGSSEYEGLS